MATPRFGRSRMHQEVTGDGGGDYTTASTSMVEISAAGLPGQTLKLCQVGEVVRLRLRAHHSNSGANTLTLNFYSVNNAAYVVTQADGVWEGPSGTTPETVEVEHFHTLVAGDLSGGVAEFEAHWATSAGTETIDNAAGTPLPQFSVENIGPERS